MLTIIKKTEILYNVYTINGVALGTFEKEIDGYFYFVKNSLDNGMVWSSELLRELANALEKLNKNYNTSVSKITAPE